MVTLAEIHIGGGHEEGALREVYRTEDTEKRKEKLASSLSEAGNGIVHKAGFKLSVTVCGLEGG